MALSQSRMRLEQGVADTPPELGFIPRLTLFPLLRVLGEQRRVKQVLLTPMTEQIGVVYKHSPTRVFVCVSCYNTSTLLRYFHFFHLELKGNRIGFLKAFGL